MRMVSARLNVSRRRNRSRSQERGWVVLWRPVLFELHAWLVAETGLVAEATNFSQKFCVAYK